MPKKKFRASPADKALLRIVEAAPDGQGVEAIVYLRGVKLCAELMDQLDAGHRADLLAAIRKLEVLKCPSPVYLRGVKLCAELMDRLDAGHRADLLAAIRKLEVLKCPSPSVECSPSSLTRRG